MLEVGRSRCEEAIRWSREKIQKRGVKSMMEKERKGERLLGDHERRGENPECRIGCSQDEGP